jgi:hypothetical protein
LAAHLGGRWIPRDQAVLSPTKKPYAPLQHVDCCRGLASPTGFHSCPPNPAAALVSNHSDHSPQILQNRQEDQLTMRSTRDWTARSARAEMKHQVGYGPASETGQGACWRLDSDSLRPMRGRQLLDYTRKGATARTHSGLQ